MYLRLTGENYTAGGFRRETLKGTLMLGKFRHRGIFVSKSKKRCAFSDRTVEALADRGRISPEKAAAYEKAMQDTIFHGDLLEHGSNDDVFRAIHRIRLSYFDKSLFWDGSEKPVHRINGTDGGALCREALEKPVYLIYLSEDEYTGDFAAFLKTAGGKKLYFLVSHGDDGLIPHREALEATVKDCARGEYVTVEKCGGCADLSTVSHHPALAEDLQADRVCFVGFGNDALMQAHDLTCDGVIFTVPDGMPAMAVCGDYTQPRYHRIFVPKGFSVFPYVSFVRETALTYYHLSLLAEKFGRSVYEKDIDALRRLWPPLFLNIYDDHLPPVIRNDFRFSGGDFMKQRETYLAEALSRFRNVQYIHACLDASDFSPCDADWNAAEKQNKLVVDGIVARRGAKLSVIVNDGTVSPRTLFYHNGDGKKYFISNFSFFMTGRLMSYYNALRADRPQEQISYDTGYLDYYRYYGADGERHETFPLYNKAAIAVHPDGSFGALTFSLGGGSVTLPSGKTVCFTPGDVNPSVPSRVAVYTPMLSDGDCGDDSLHYTLEVGKDRLNLIIVGEKITAVRKGGVLLPPMGVVLSLSPEHEAAADFAAFDSDGYADGFPRDIRIRISVPEGVDKDRWENAVCIYGGGIALMEGGKELLREDDLSEFRREGWLTPLSLQTQESPQHAIARQPRTEVGVTRDGRLFILVISGRSNTSAGADYFEVCKAAQRLIPNIDCLISFDGGGSSVLGLLDGNLFTEISLPAPSDNSLYGMARELNSLLKVEAE